MTGDRKWEEVMDLFRRRLGREPTPEEQINLRRGLEMGRNPRRMMAGYQATDYHRRHRGPNAMSEIRSHRRHERPSDLRRRAHALLDELLDLLEGAAVRAGDEPRGSRRRGRWGSGRDDAEDRG